MWTFLCKDDTGITAHLLFFFHIYIPFCHSLIYLFTNEQSFFFFFVNMIWMFSGCLFSCERPPPAPHPRDGERGLSVTVNVSGGQSLWGWLKRPSLMWRYFGDDHWCSRSVKADQRCGYGGGDYLSATSVGQKEAFQSVIILKVQCVGVRTWSANNTQPRKPNFSVSAFNSFSPCDKRAQKQRAEKNRLDWTSKRKKQFKLKRPVSFFVERGQDLGRNLFSR